MVTPRSALAALLSLGLLAGCPSGGDPDDDAAGDDDATGGDDTADDDTGDDDTADDDVADDDSTDDDAPLVAAHVIDGDVTWTLDFDADAEAAGFADCSYARSYAGLQFLDQPYLCPACTHQFAGTATMVEGFEDCYEPVFGGEIERTEYWGLAWPGAEPGDGAFFRGSTENLSIRELTTLTGVALDAPFALAWESEYTLDDLGVEAPGSVLLAASGTATVSVDDDTLLADPTVPRSEPYACGWPLGNPGTLTTDWALAPDATFPTAWLEDACGEAVDLWDLHGSYLVVDSTQHDCGYCLQMAQAAPDFLGEMAAQGIEVRFVSLLGEGLSNVIGTPSQAAFDSYESGYGVDGQPLLKDRGFGYAVFRSYWEDDIGWPVWAVVRPDMTVLHVGKGYDGWDEIRDLILDDR